MPSAKLCLEAVTALLVMFSYHPRLASTSLETAAPLLRVLATSRGEPVDILQRLFPDCPFGMFVDDTSFSCTGTIRHVARRLAAAVACAVRILQSLKLEISPEKSIGVASRPRMQKALQEQMRARGLDFAFVFQSKQLGCPRGQEKSGGGFQG